MDIEKYKKNPKTSFLAESYEKLEKEEQGLKQMTEKDPSLKELVSDDLKKITEQKELLLGTMEDILGFKEKEEKFPSEVILEVRAGAGGEEAALFAEKLAEMYEKYAQKQGWSFL